MNPARPKALVFDVFGTLVDWRGSVAREVAEVFGDAVDAVAFAEQWRAEYEPAMAPIRDGRRGYTALDVLHRENLDRVLARCPGLPAIDRDALATAWERLDPWPDVTPALSELRPGLLLAPCSNGSVGLMARLARHAGFHWDAILGAEVAQNYKPHAAVYRASCAALRLEPAEVMMVAAHNGDLAAAQDCGLLTGFFPRRLEHGPGQETDLAPTGDWDLVASDLGDLAERLAERFRA